MEEAIESIEYCNCGIRIKDSQTLIIDTWDYDNQEYETEVPIDDLIELIVEARPEMRCPAYGGHMARCGFCPYSFTELRSPEGNCHRYDEYQAESKEDDDGCIVPELFAAVLDYMEDDDE